MFQKFYKIFSTASILFLIFFTHPVFSKVVKNFEISGNERIPEGTIKMLSGVSINDNLEIENLNDITINLYNSNFFENVTVKFENNILSIIVLENPIIESIIFKGIKADRIQKTVSENLKLKSRSSFNEILLRADLERIKNALKDLGFYFSEVDVFLEKLDDNKVSLIYEVDLGAKSKIKKITFIGDKIFKDSKLKNVIISEEHKFWKFLSGRKYLNENTINFDKTLLKNFYLSKGYYNASINTSFAKIIDDNQFELIFNINANDKYYFNKLNLKIPNDFDEKNFVSLNKLFKKAEGEIYSINLVKKILDEIDYITTTEEYHSISSTVEENIIDNKINLTFEIKETKKLVVEKINVFGNNVTHESVIRNKLVIDEGDPFNEILQAKSINNLKSLNFFKSVKSDVLEGSLDNSKIINIYIEEKATGEISAGAGVGTTGGTVTAGVKENNYLGKGVSVEANATIDEESIKGLLRVNNPNYKNTDKSISASIEAIEIDRIKDFGYKNNKFGFSLGSSFEFLDDLNLGLSTSSFYEKIETDSTASARQKKQEGDYWDTFIKTSFDLDKRDQVFQTSKGFRSRYILELPVLSDTNTLTNHFDYKVYTQLFDQNVSSASFFFKAAKSITNEDIKLTERLFVPSKNLRGFEKGKIGPRDGNDFIGGNFVSAMNLSTSLPQILENVQNMDVVLFFDAANVWGVDYDSSLDTNDSIRSSIGVGLDWFTLLGPLNFSLAVPLTKDTSDKTESFRFNLGTTF